MDMSDCDLNGSNALDRTQQMKSQGSFDFVVARFANKHFAEDDMGAYKFCLACQQHHSTCY
jgi:hypothetical protein